jgi:hypothetical protein
MGHRRIMELVIVGLWVTVAVTLVQFKNHKTVVPVPNKLLPKIAETEIGKTYEIRKLTVIRGDSFDLTIRDGNDSRVLVKLPVVAVENSKGKVLDLLSHCTNPKVVFREKQPDGRWQVDFLFTQEGKELNLSDWLTSNKLVYK